MYLAYLHLRAFRNFEDQAFEFCPSFNVLVGDNAQGKTNVIEAIAFLSTGKSFRATEWRDLIGHGRGCAAIEARSASASGDDVVSVTLAEPRKRFSKNGKNTTPGGFGAVHTVLFAPEEIQLLRTQPAARRRYIDGFVAAFVPGYRKRVRDYESVVSQRNRLLTDDELREEEKRARLAPWDDQLISLGARIMMARAEWVGKINALLPTHYNTIAAGDGAAQLRYEPNVAAEALSPDAIMARFRDRMEERRGDELIRRSTLVGPHRDDFIACIGDGMVKRFASQGQHRSFVLALKITEAEIYRRVTGEAPILLLDDVASELDPERNRRLFEYVRGADGQVFITTTRLEDVKLKDASSIRCFFIERGSATPSA